MIINCPECNHEVSDKAKMCPNCGCPINDEIITEETIDELLKEEPTTITIEHTKKKYKLIQLFGFLSLIVGLVWYFANRELNPELASGLFWGCALLAIILFIVARIGIWWDHA